MNRSALPPEARGLYPLHQEFPGDHTHTDQIRKSRDLVYIPMCVVCYFVQVVEFVFGNSCLMQMLKPEISKLFHITWSMCGNLFRLTGHLAYLSLVYHISFVLLAFGCTLFQV